MRPVCMVWGSDMMASRISRSRVSEANPTRDTVLLAKQPYPPFQASRGTATSTWALWASRDSTQVSKGTVRLGLLEGEMPVWLLKIGSSKAEWLEWAFMEPAKTARAYSAR